jgi:hypothetical protein
VQMKRRGKPITHLKKAKGRRGSQANAVLIDD